MAWLVLFVQCQKSCATCKGGRGEVGGRGRAAGRAQWHARFGGGVERANGVQHWRAGVALTWYSGEHLPDHLASACTISPPRQPKADLTDSILPLYAPTLMMYLSDKNEQR